MSDDDMHVNPDDLRSIKSTLDIAGEVASDVGDAITFWD
jgi:hypothetical protein